MWVRALQLFSVMGRLLYLYLVKCWTIFHCFVDLCLSALFGRALDIGTHGHSFKLVVLCRWNDYKR